MRRERGRAAECLGIRSPTKFVNCSDGDELCHRALQNFGKDPRFDRKIAKAGRLIESASQNYSASRSAIYSVE